MSPLKKNNKPSFGKVLDKVFQEAVEKEVEKHRLAGNSIPVFREGKTILIPPEQIKPLAEKRKGGKVKKKYI